MLEKIQGETWFTSNAFGLTLPGGSAARKCSKVARQCFHSSGAVEEPGSMSSLPGFNRRSIQMFLAE
ncbi:hypothetical protein M513_08594 [Trichuris suis]|uniref:Uncharacterized protein n=1 Tax=Trichuris suis TaxID=68888 RepID=A0A085LZY0_9BILA|nr:hypothetical protein M513_08594 [Trichuris suis]